MKSLSDAAATADHGCVSAHELPAGKRKLIEAALRLPAGGRHVASLGLRELARQAGLNSNTIYRHFDTLDEAHSVPRRACIAFFAFRLDNREAS